MADVTLCSASKLQLICLHEESRCVRDFSLLFGFNPYTANSPHTVSKTFVNNPTSNWK